MKKMDFLPVIIGSDDNGYGAARAIHEQYGIKSIVVTRKDILPTMHSKIIEKMYIDDLENIDTFAQNLTKVYEKYSKRAEKLVLIACNENYEELIILNV